MKMKHVRIKYIDYRSLKPLLRVIHKEKHYRIQVVSLESFSTFTELLSYKRIQHNLVTSPFDAFSEKDVNVLTQGVCFGHLKPGRYILFSNIVHSDFLQLLFKIDIDEKVRYFTLRYGSSVKKVVEAYGRTRTLHEIERIINQGDQRVPSPLISYVETIVLLLCRGNTFGKICKEASQMDRSLANRFLVAMTLNGLVERGLAMKRGHRYRINVSHESLSSACKNVGVDSAIFQ